MNIIDKIALCGSFRACMYQHRSVLDALESRDPAELVWAMRQIKRGSMAGFEQTLDVSYANTVVNEYRNFLLELGVGGGTVISNVRMGLFSNDVAPGRTLTLATMSGTLTEFTDFTVESGNSTNRAPYTGGSAASQSIDNSASPSRFTFTGTGTIRGSMIILGATLKDGSLDSTPPNILVAAGRLPADQPIQAAGAILDITYTQSNDT